MGTISKLDEPGRRRGVGFGTSQDRKLFPTNFAPNRLGNQMFRKEEPHRGPGCYENHEVGRFVSARIMNEPGVTKIQPVDCAQC